MFGKTIPKVIFLVALFSIISLHGTPGKILAVSPKIASPDQKGPYNVGITFFDAALTGGRVTKITAIYPTTDVNPALEDNRPYHLTVPLVDLRSPLNAILNASLADGTFPLIVNQHGGAVGEINVHGQIALNEFLASHGFIVATYRRHGSCSAALGAPELNDPRILITHILDKNNDDADFFNGHIDADKIGVTAISAGAPGAISLASGSLALDADPDGRVKAFVFLEPNLNGCGVTSEERNSMTTPYLIMSGNQFNEDFEIAFFQFFNDTTAATPRIYVHNPHVGHVGYSTSICSNIDDLRETSLQLQLDAGLTLVDPLVTALPANVDGGTSAQANMFWRLDEVVNPSLAGGRHFCDRVGVNSAFVSPVDINIDDSPLDGFTDAPPFLPQNPPTISSEKIARLVKLYSVSFWKVILEGDRRYMPFLTPGYANKNEPDAIVFKVGD